MSNPPTTFAASALRAIRKESAAMRESDPVAFYEDLRGMDYLVSTIEESSHFVMPDDGRIIDDDMQGLVGLPLRLPFPRITVSFSYSPEKTPIQRASTEIASPQQLLVAEEVTLDEALLARAAYPAEHMRKHLGSKVIFCSVVSRVPRSISPSELVWQAMPVAWVFPPVIEQPLVKRGAATISISPTAPTTCFCVVLKPKILRDSVKAIMEDSKETESVAEAKGAMGMLRQTMALLELLEALSCSNVHAVKRQHASPSVNARRIRDGKLPLLDTWELTIEAPVGRNEDTGDPIAPSIAGGRSSPRQHLRRGHIRTYKATGKRIWINNTIVGLRSEGRIEKIYKVQPQRKN